jgi:hypothetical protein
MVKEVHNTCIIMIVPYIRLHQSLLLALQQPYMCVHHIHQLASITLASAPNSSTCACICISLHQSLVSVWHAVWSCKPTLRDIEESHIQHPTNTSAVPRMGRLTDQCPKLVELVTTLVPKNFCNLMYQQVFRQNKSSHKYLKNVISFFTFTALFIQTFFKAFEFYWKQEKLSQCV